MFPEVAELVFSLVVGYMGALEFLYVVRHLYHWSFRHNPEIRDLKSEAESLQKLQDHLRNSIFEASEKESLGLKAMKDGVLYKDGFRVNADQKEIDELKEKVRKQEQNQERKREIEAELARQRKIEEETRAQLKAAEEELRRIEEEKERERLKAEREKEEKEKAEEEENMRKILEAERQLAEEHRRLEEEEHLRKLEEEENTRRLLEVQREEEERQRLQELEEEEDTRKLLAAEREFEEIERQRELEEENNRKLLEAEKEREEKQRLQELEEENARILLEAEKERAEAERLQEEIVRQRQLEEENNRKLLEAEREREERQRLQELEEENARKLLEAERERAEAERLQDIEDEKIIRKLLEAERIREAEEEAENTRKLLEAEREDAERLLELDQENTRELLEAERELQEEQRRIDEEQSRQRIEEEENYRRLLQMERDMEERERQVEEEKQALLDHTAALERETAERLLAAERETELKQRQIEENEENMRMLLEAERELELKKQEMEEEAESLRQLIEAEKEREEHQRRIDEEALQKLNNAQEEVELKQTYDIEAEESKQPLERKEISRSEQSPTQTVKTQYGQRGSDSPKSKTLLFPSVSEDSSSAEPVSSKQSSFSTQQSSEAVLPELLFDEYERKAPDGGEDMPSLQYSDDYLRSLDGIKNKPLVREDGSGRRRAFKKRRSSGSSTSSRESRASREEELKMFTSLEEEELESIRKGDNDYETIKYTSEPNLKVGKQHRRHKRSPAKDAKRDASDVTKGSLEMLDEEDSNPWGEVKPEHYKDTDFWKRERNTSIDEELEETDAKQRVQLPSLSAVNIPKMSSFEEATKSQHEEAISVLQRQRSKDREPIKEPDEESDTKNVSKVGDARLSPAGSNSSPASASASISPALISPEPERENSQEKEDAAARTPSPTGTGSGLRRSPRVDEMKLYKEQWQSEDRKARADAGENPTIEIDYASDDEIMPEPDEEEYLMEGISDFYDFNASINPSRSRSRSRSRSKTPAVNRSVSPHQRRTPSPQNLSHNPATTKSRSPSPDPASYKFIYQRILPSLAAEHQDIDGLSDFYDFNSKLNREALSGVTTRRSSEVHRTSVDYVIDDLKDDKHSVGGAIARQIHELRRTPTTPDYERSISAEWRDIQKLKDELLSGTFKRSTYVGESMDFSDQFENLREEAKTFRRSRSKSRSPGLDAEKMATSALARKELQAKILEDITKTSENFVDFSSDITKPYVDRNRRASDTALIQKPEILFQIQDLIQESDENLEAEEYHHFRRFSLNQEVPVDQYPEDYVLEVKSMGDLRTWSGDVDSPNIEEGVVTLESEANVPKDQKPHEDNIEEPYESGSDDERQTVVEVEDEIDEDIWDYNERPEESHNEQSECEEADREMDRYAGRHADDWRDVEGAVGGVLDEDSFQIDQIYDEAIKNRKPSGILRDYDSILQGIHVSDEDRLDEESYLPNDTISNGNGSNSLWSPRSRSSRASSGESSRSFLENERRNNEHERRYLGDATMEAINSTRLRSRYGIVPSTSFTTTYDDDTEIDINYVPRKEYNWRKNFKLDDEGTGVENENHIQYLDSRKFSLGGESITLFSRSPEHSGEEGELKRVTEADEDTKEPLEEEMEQEPEDLAMEKQSKKKKNRRKSRKGSKGSIGGNDDEVESVSRRNSIIPEGDLPKKKSRRESKGTIDVISEFPSDVARLPDEEMEDAQPKKKSKKRRKAKQESALPTLEIRLPSPEKKPTPPSVAAIRAALTAAPPAEVKHSPEIPRKFTKIVEPLREEKIPVTPRESPIIEPKPSPSSVRTSVSPQPAPISAAIPNGEPPCPRSKTPEPSNIPLRPPSPTLAAQNSSQNQSNDKPKTTSVPPDAYDIIIDGGLYPLF